MFGGYLNVCGSARRTIRVAAPQAAPVIVNLNSDDEEFDECSSVRPVPRGRGRGCGRASSNTAAQPRNTQAVDQWHGYVVDGESYAWPEAETLGHVKTADCKYFFGVHTLHGGKKCRICGYVLSWLCELKIVLTVDKENLCCSVESDDMQNTSAT